MSAANGSFLERRFGLQAKGTNVRTELIAGATTFLTMAYIIFVNPKILSAAGFDHDGLVVVTCLASAVMTIAMGFIANMPICLAPGMGLNAFVAFTLVLQMGLTPQQALGIVFVSGLITVVLTFFNIRELIVHAIPAVLKKSTAVGIGLFIAFLGFKNIGLIVPDPATYLTYTKHWTPSLILSLVGVALMGILIIRKVKGAILIGILAVSALGMGMRMIDYALHDSQLSGRAWLPAVGPGALQAMGLQSDDVISSVGGQPVASPAELAAVVAAPSSVEATGTGVAPGTLVASNPPGGETPGGPAPVTSAIPVTVLRSRFFFLRSEATLAVRPDQLEALKAAAGPGGAVVPLGFAPFAGLPTGVVSLPHNLGKTMFQFSLSGIFTATFIAILFSYVFVDLFDTIGTLIAVGYKAGLTDEEGNLPQIREALQVDAWAAVVAASMGTSSVTSYIESAAGVEEGGRTGLMAVFCGLFFILAMFFVPLIGAVPAYAISPCLIIVGLAMLDHINAIDWANFEDAIPAFMTILLMPLAHNISVGLGFGFLAYVVIKLALGKVREVHPVLYVICALFVVNLAVGG